jgi:uncharacterized protein (UPF0248 family)
VAAKSPLSNDGFQKRAEERTKEDPSRLKKWPDKRNDQLAIVQLLQGARIPAERALEIVGPDGEAIVREVYGATGTAKTVAGDHEIRRGQEGGTP